MIERILLQIQPLDSSAMEKCQIRLDNLTKPLNSLHSFEHLALKMAGVTRTARPGLRQSSLVIANGSRRMAGIVDVFAEHVNARVVAFDREGKEAPTIAEMTRMMETGMKIAACEIEKGSQVIGIGMVGEVSADACEMLMSWYQDEKMDPRIALVQAGSHDTAGLVGVILGACAGGAAVVLDGLATGCAALVASRMSPLVKDYLVGAHSSAEEGYPDMLRMLELPSYLHLGMNLGEGVGAALGISLINASLHILNDMKTFGDAEVDVAEDGPGALVQDSKVRG